MSLVDLTSLVAGGWRDAGPVQGASGAAWGAADLASSPLQAQWGDGAQQTIQILSVQPAQLVFGAQYLAPWQPAADTSVAAIQATWQPMDARVAGLAAVWGGSAGLSMALQDAWSDALVAQAAASLAWRPGGPLGLLRVLSTDAGAQANSATLVPWGRAGWHISTGGVWVPPVQAGITPCYMPPPGGAVVLRFAEQLAALGTLLFACRHALPPVGVVVVPVQEVYMVTNITTLKRVADGQSIVTLGMSLILDVESWAWGFSATLPADQLGAVEPSAPGEPIELEAVVNGTAVRVIVESISRDRVFGQAGVRIQGRSKSAVLAAPFYPLGVFGNSGGARTSQQLLDAALPSGWTADWGLTAWLVPAGAWSHQGTPITAALAIAAAGGGYIQPHGTANLLRVLPRYPLAPWDWAAATPDIELPAAVATREGIEWVDKPVYNRVFVSGTTLGVLGQATRAGTAGDLVAQMVTDPLITHVDAVRQRALPVLADGGRQAKVQLRMPVLPATGVIPPGKLVRYIDGATTRVGLSRAVSVDVGLPEVWQTVTLETHV